jgi:ABC-type sugar transport system substrate-binding protein
MKGKGGRMKYGRRFGFLGISLTCALACLAPAVHAKPLKMAFFITRQEDDRFYRSVVGFMREAAKDLDVALTVYEAKDDHFKMSEQVQEAVQQDFDALIVVNFKGRGPGMIKMCEAADVPIFFENSGILDDTIGAPRERYACYLGEMVPDDEAGSYDLTQKLIAAAKVSGDGNIYIAGIEGQLMTMASNERVKGFKRAVAEYPNVKLTQVVSADWDFDVAKDKATLLKKRYPELSVIWTASDGMALGVIEAMNALPDANVVTGGVDWTAKGIEAIKSGEMVASAGANVFEAAWALIVLHDYFHGIDFAETEGLKMRSNMPLMTLSRVEEYEKALDPTTWQKINFRNFSKHYNHSLKKYDFGIESILRELDQSRGAARGTQP